MKHVDSDTYNVAWFKLADCIARGEKERALGVFRLLSHSFDDSALACQLYADILRSFDDPAAIAKYQEAAGLYRSRKQFLEAAAVYEHLATLDPENSAFRLAMIELYQQLNIRSKVTQYVQKLLQLLLQKNEWKKAIEIVMEYEMAGDCAFTAQLHEQMLFHLTSVKDVLADTKLVHAKKAIDAWSDLDDDGKQLRGFGNLCFPKDLKSFIFFAKSIGLDDVFLQNIWDQNLKYRPREDWKKIPGAFSNR